MRSEVIRVTAPLDFSATCAWYLCSLMQATITKFVNAAKHMEGRKEWPLYRFAILITGMLKPCLFVIPQLVLPVLSSESTVLRLKALLNKSSLSNWRQNYTHKFSVIPVKKQLKVILQQYRGSDVFSVNIRIHSAIYICDAQTIFWGFWHFEPGNQEQTGTLCLSLYTTYTSSLGFLHLQTKLNKTIYNLSL